MLLHIHKVMTYLQDSVGHIIQQECQAETFPDCKTCTQMTKDQNSCHKWHHKVCIPGYQFLQKGHLDKQPCTHPCVKITTVGHLCSRILCRSWHSHHCSYCMMDDKTGIVLLHQHMILLHISSHIFLGHACIPKCMRCRLLHFQYMSDRIGHTLHKPDQNLAHAQMCHQGKSSHSFHC